MTGHLPGRSLAVEGLPGAGKSTLIASIKTLRPDIKVVPELVLTPPLQPGRSFFIANDRRKTALIDGISFSVVDRFWASTVAYVIAEERLSRMEISALDVAIELYGAVPPIPSLCIFLDSHEAVLDTHATDGYFHDRDFRVLLRTAYLDVLEAFEVPTIRVGHGRGLAAWHIAEQRLGAQERAASRPCGTF